MRLLLYLFLLFSALLSAQTSTQKNYNLSNGLTSLNISDITQDRIGYLWIGTFDNGLIRYDGDDFEGYKVRENLPSNKINALAFVNDTLFVATNKGLAVKTSSTDFVTITSLEILKIKEVQNKVLLMTHQGIYLYNKNAVTPLKLHDQIDLSPTNDIAYFNNGYYIASNKALWYVNTLSNPDKVIRIHNGEYTSLSILKGKMFATSTSLGIQVFEQNRNQFHFKDVKNITSVGLFENEYWLATSDNGIYIYDAHFNFEKRISKYNELSVNSIRKIFVDRRKNCWLATYGNGLYSYAATSATSSLPSYVYFENIEVDYKVLDSIPINNYNGTLQLKSKQNNISFSFKTVDINYNGKVEYQWRLNDKVGPWTSKSSVDFANLNPGKYNFEVRSKSGEETTISHPKNFTFFIDTPLYKKKWFLYSSIASLVALVVLIMLLIIKNMRRKNKKRIELLELNNHLLTLEQKALQLQMNPHFIFNVLNNIKALGSQQKEQDMHDAINNFAVLLRSILHNSRKEELTLQEEIDTLKRYVALEQQMSENSFQFIVDTSSISIDIDEILIPSMLIQPFVENAIKHGIPHLEKEGLISLTFEIKNEYLICILKDNGIGYKRSQQKHPKKNHKSVALHVTKERIEHISGERSFYISEIVNKGAIEGTKVWFKVPLKTDF